MKTYKLVILLLSLHLTLLACSNKDEDAEILIRPIKTCEGLQVDNGRAYIEGDALYIAATVTAARRIATYRLHGPIANLTGEQSIDVYELHGFFGQDYEEDEYISEIDVQMALSGDRIPREIVIKCKDDKQALVRIPLV